MPRKGEAASQYLLRRSRPLRHVLLSLPQPRCSLKSERCGFNAVVPDPHHTHIFVLSASLHSRCQAVTSTIVSGTRWSLRRRKKGARGGGLAGGEHKSRCVPGGWVTSSHQLGDALFIAARLIRSPAPSSLGGVPGLGLPAGCPINHAGPLGSAHRAGVLPASGL